jgi:uncharacterized protein (TIRG00374 family)
MSDHSFLKRRWKLLLNLLTIAALILLVYLIRNQIIDTFKNLGEINLWWVTLLPPLLALNFHAQTMMYFDMFKLLGNKLRYNHMLKVAIELNFINKVFPSGGVSGISYFGVRLRGDDITGGRASMVQIMKLILLFISFEVLLVFALFLMALEGKANDMVILVGGSISTLLVIGTLAFAAIIGSERRIHHTFGAITRGLNTMIRWVRPNHPETINIARAEKTVQEFHNTYVVLAANYRKLRSPLLWALLINACEIFSIYAIYIAFGEWVNIGAIILAYAVANFAGLISVLPGGIGIYEALMTGVLAAAGIPPALSLPVTVMFRVLSTTLQVIPGYYLYHKAVNEAGNSLKPKHPHTLPQS